MLLVTTSCGQIHRVTVNMPLLQSLEAWRLLDLRLVGSEGFLPLKPLARGTSLNRGDGPRYYHGHILRFEGHLVFMGFQLLVSLKMVDQRLTSRLSASEKLK
jgi:hypothetical protein